MEQTAEGLLLSGVGGLYTIRLTNETTSFRTLTCRAKGAFRYLSEKPMIGDRVTLRFDDTASQDTAVIRSILPRRSMLIRPPVANVTHLFIVTASAQPAPVTDTLDKLTAIAVHSSITPVIVVTKCDIDNKSAQGLAALYQNAGFPVFLISPEDKKGDRKLSDFLFSLPVGSVAAFAGASGVGKSSLLNRLFPYLSLSTGEVSRRIERGRHTTRRVDLFPLRPESEASESEEIYLADTPGFSLLDFVHFDFFELEDLFDAYPDFHPYLGKCRYADCTHTGEGAQDCAVARAVESGEIAASRHESYQTLYRTLKEKKNRY